MPKTNVTIDWLSYTMAAEVKKQDPHGQAIRSGVMAYRCTGQTGEWEQVEPLHGYSIVVESVERPGLRVMMAGAAEGMGTHVEWSGRALRGIDVAARLSWTLLNAGRITRLDVALDVAGTLDFRRLYDMLEKGRAKTRSKKYSLITSGSGTTIYVGSRSSEQMLRIYDKQAESNLSEPLWRIELECKGEKANGIGQYLARYGLDNIRAIIRAFCDFPDNEEWDAMFKAFPAIGVPKAEKVTDRDKWLREQVKPVLAKEMLDGNAAAWDAITFALAGITEHEFTSIVALAQQRRSELY